MSGDGAQPPGGRGGDRPPAPRPPAIFRALLALLLPAGERSHLLAEMDDLHGRRATRSGRLRATLWYLRHTLGFGLRFAPRLPARLSPPALATLHRDLRHGVRALARRPGYAATTVLTLGIGIGGAGTVYTASNWALLRPVPGVHEPDELVTIRLEIGEASPEFPVSQPDLETLEARLASLTSLAAATEYQVNLDPAADANPWRAAAAVVTSDYFEVLGVSAEAGRVLGGGTGVEDAGVAVVSHRMARDLERSSGPVIGRTLRVNGHPYTVVGVAPPGFHGAELPGGFDLWLPPSAFPHVDPDASPDVLSRRGSPLWTKLVGRRLPGATPAAIEAEGGRAIDAVREEHAPPHSFMANFTLRAYLGVGLAPRARSTARRMVGVLGVGALILLLLACANAANLGLARASARRGSTAVHRALGASGGRVAGLVLVEHVVLGIAGGALGAGLAAVGTGLFSEASLSRFGASLEGIQMDGRVLAFVAATAIGAALLTGALPAWIASRDRLLPGLRGQAHGSRRVAGAQGALVAAQVALSAVLLVGAGLMARTVLKLDARELGFDPSASLRFSIDPRAQGYDEEEVRSLLGRIEARLREEPGVLAAGFAAPSPVSGSFLTDLAALPGSEPDGEDAVHGAGFQVTAGFLEALGGRLRGGRWYDAAESPRVGEPPDLVVITESAAREAFPAAPPDAVPGRLLGRARGPTTRVAGVVADLRLTGPHRELQPIFFRPWGDGPAWVDVAGIVRTTSDPARFAPALRRVVGSVAPSLPVYDVRTVQAQVDRLVVEQRLAARLAVILAAIGAVLTGVGLYGVLGYAVVRRRREIAVRSALGAGPASVVGRFVRYGALLTVAGLAAGLVGAAVLTRSLEAALAGPEALLFGVEPLDAATFGIGALAMLAVAAVAAWIPARRATRLDPVEILAES